MKYIKTKLLLLFSVCAISLTGCVNEEPRDSTLRILCHRWLYEKLDIQTFADRYAAVYPDEKIEIEIYDNYKHLSNPLENKENLTKFDLFLGLSREHIVNQARAEEIISFESGFFDSELRRDNFFSTFIELGVIDGRQYMIPLLGEVMSVVIRKDLFAAAWLTDSNGRPVEPDSWESLVEAAEQIQSVNKDVYGLAIDFGQNLMLYNFYGCLQANRGTIFDRSSFSLDTGSEGVEYILSQWLQAVESGLCPTDVFHNVDAARDLFRNGGVAILVTPHSRWKELSVDMGEDKVALIPLPGALSNGSLAYIHGAVISSQSPNKESAVRFIKEQLLSADCQVACMKRYGKIPSILKNYNRWESAEWERIFEWVRDAITLPIDSEWNKKDAVFYEHVKLYLTGIQPLDATIRSITSDFDAIKREGES